MDSAITQALQRFESMCQNWSGPGRMRLWAASTYIWEPDAGESRGEKPIGLTLQALTHGNEIGGLDVMLALLELLQNGILRSDLALGFVLGNPAAARVDCRFLESDLNRAFGQRESRTQEQRRAQELEGLLKQTRYFIDFHQTIEPTLSPFFIFPYTAPCFAFAAALHASIPIVTHWGQAFSKDGMCSDEYVNFMGGTGITLELGQKGFHPYHTGVGLHVALSALELARAETAPASEIRPGGERTIYTWKAIVMYQPGMVLREGLVNFQTLQQGEDLGREGDAALPAKSDGWLLFPKYPRDPNAPPSKELYRIMKKIKPQELGQEGVIER